MDTDACTNAHAHAHAHTGGRRGCWCQQGPHSSWLALAHTQNPCAHAYIHAHAHTHTHNTYTHTHTHAHTGGR